MNDNFAVVRRSLMPPSFGCSCRHCEALRRVPDILTAIEAELAALRANALDLSKVPEGWEFVSLDVMADTGLECTLRRSGDDLSDDVYGGGSTPAAVAKIGGGG